jgi:probable rRNA maturation factor
MTSSGSTLLFGAIPDQFKPSPGEKRALSQFIHTLCREVCDSRPFVCLLAGDDHLQTLNRDFLGHNYPTDVLSFPTAAAPQVSELGEIAISLERAAAQAAAFGHRTVDEIKILMLHGVLHLTGLDHENRDSRMAREENRWRAQLKLPQTLITRSRRSTAQ